MIFDYVVISEDNKSMIQICTDINTKQIMEYLQGTVFEARDQIGYEDNYRIHWQLKRLADQVLSSDEMFSYNIVKGVIIEVRSGQEGVFEITYVSALGDLFVVHSRYVIATDCHGISSNNIISVYELLWKLKIVFDVINLEPIVDTGYETSIQGMYYIPYEKCAAG